MREPTGFFESEKFVNKLIQRSPVFLLVRLIVRRAASICLKVRRPACKLFKPQNPLKGKNVLLSRSDKKDTLGLWNFLKVKLLGFCFIIRY